MKRYDIDDFGSLHGTPDGCVCLAADVEALEKRNGELEAECKRLREALTVIRDDTADRDSPSYLVACEALAAKEARE